jgi:hypothetical protein
MNFFLHYESALVDIFSSNHSTQPLFRLTSKKIYQASVTSFLELQANYAITQQEYYQYAMTNNKEMLIFHFKRKNTSCKMTTCDKKLLHSDSLTPEMNNCWKHESNLKYPSNQGLYYLDTQVKSVECSFPPQAFLTMLDNSSHKLLPIDFLIDPFSAYNIFSKRLSCVQLIKGYAKDMAIKTHEQNLTFLKNTGEYSQFFIYEYLSYISAMLEDMPGLSITIEPISNATIFNKKWDKIKKCVIDDVESYMITVNSNLELLEVTIP